MSNVANQISTPNTPCLLNVGIELGVPPYQVDVLTIALLHASNSHFI